MYVLCEMHEAWYSKGQVIDVPFHDTAHNELWCPHRNFFGVHVCVQRPTSEDMGSGLPETNEENKMILVSSDDKFSLTQDICVMCGAFGTDQEARLIACAQCGQCYHPYCINTKVKHSFHDL